MKKTLQFILVFIMGLSVFLLSNLIVIASEKSTSIFDNSIRLSTTNNNGLSHHWSDFKFKDIGNGDVSLRLFYNGKLLEPESINPMTRLSSDITIKFIDNTGVPYYQEAFRYGRTLKQVATQLSKNKFRPGLDSIQIIQSYERMMIAITGSLYANFENIDFATTLTKNQSEQYSFRVENEGLYVERRNINQVRIPDGEYVIETAEDSNKVFDVISGNNIEVNNYDKNAPYQKFRLEYDNKNKAYKIKVNFNDRVLNWDHSNGNNVNNTSDRNYGEQFWYLENAGNGKHRLINARNTNKVLDLNRSNNNIEVHDSHGGLNQQFKFVKPADKENSIIKGDWKISSKLDNNKVLNAYYTGSQNGNVVLSYNSGTYNQIWTFEYDSSKGAYAIINKSTGKVLAWDSNTNRNVFTWDYNLSGDDARWILEDVGSGYYIIKNYKNQNLVLDVPESNPTNGISLIVSERHGNNNQQFKLIK